MTAAECTADDCSSAIRARGFCRTHYNRWLRRGTPALATKPTTAERFWTKVDKTSTCWTWLGYRTPKGYGIFCPAGQGKIYAHRWAYIDAHGPIPVELVLDHLCRNTSCVRPAHLEAVTPAENTRRGLAGAWQSAKTHCPKGHPYDAENTYLSARSGGKVFRHCITCKKEATRAWRRRLKEVAA